MKIMKSYRQWIPVIGIPLFLISGFILYFPFIALQIFKLHWISLLILLVLVCSPRRNLRLSSNELEPPRYTRSSWLLQIFILQLSLGAIFLGICTCCGQSAPVITSPQIDLFPKTMTHLLTSESLFPWGFITVTAILMGYHAYRLGEDAYWASILETITSQPIAKIIINFIARMSTLLAYGLTICLIALLWASMAAPAPLVTGFYLTPMLVTLILLLLSFTKTFRRHLTKAMGKDIPLAAGLFLWTVFLAAAVWLLNGFLAPWTHIAMAPASLLKHWLNKPWYDLWLIFANCFWMLWMPVLGIIIAKISRGYQIWEVIAATLTLPLAAALVFYFTQPYHWNPFPIYSGLIAAAGLLVLFLFTLRNKAVPILILTYLPRRDHYKFRSFRRTVVRIAQCAIAILFIYLPSGIYLSQFFLFAASLGVLILALISLAALLLDFSHFRRR